MEYVRSFCIQIHIGQRGMIYSLEFEQQVDFFIILLDDLIQYLESPILIFIYYFCNKNLIAPALCLAE